MTKLTIPTIKEVNAETGEEIVRDMNAQELAQFEIDKAAYLTQMQEIASKAQAKAALLERLGITADEAALLLS